MYVYTRSYITFCRSVVPFFITYSYKYVFSIALCFVCPGNKVKVDLLGSYATKFIKMDIYTK